MLHDGRRHWRTAVVPSLRKHARWRLRRDDGVGRALTELLQPLLHRRGLGVCAARLRLLRDAWQRVHPQERGRVPVPRLRRSRAQWRVPRGRALLEAARRAWQVLRGQVKHRTEPDAGTTVLEPGVSSVLFWRPAPWKLLGQV